MTTKTTKYILRATTNYHNNNKWQVIILFLFKIKTKKKKTPSANEQILFFVYCAVKWKKKFVGRINMFLAVVQKKYPLIK